MWFLTREQSKIVKEVRKSSYKLSVPLQLSKALFVHSQVEAQASVRISSHLEDANTTVTFTRTGYSITVVWGAEGVWWDRTEGQQDSSLCETCELAKQTRQPRVRGAVSGRNNEGLV